MRCWKYVRGETATSSSKKSILQKNHCTVCVVFFCSPVPKHKQEEEPVHCPDIQAFYLEEVEPPVILPSISPETKQTQNTDLGASTVSETDPNPVGLEEMEESGATTQEVSL